MKVKNAANGKAARQGPVLTARESMMDENSGLTPREHEILGLMLDGLSPKEIANKLDVSYKGVDFHRGNLYRKLGIRSMQELLIIFANKKISEPIIGTETNVSLPKKFIPAIYKSWITYKDDASSVNFSIKSKGIYILSGSQGKEDGFAVVVGLPDYDTGIAMRSMSMFSFKVLGDGNDYLVMLPTMETKEAGDHYSKQFSTQNGKITTITVNINNELAQPFWSDITREFIQDNIIGLQFHNFRKQSFNLLIWDINLYP
ncbi:MAG: helix-turn-helix transcriptional regulator [Treponema sp.]|nr:helix-turn-helix transcriptional regulator [Treponema sp.]